MQVRVCNYRNRQTGAVETTSRANGWNLELSPFLLGPVPLYDGHQALKMENAWQYSKLYAEHADKMGNPTQAYWEWAARGWGKRRADRYPMGKGAVPLCSLWEGERLSYVEARKHIYCPLYANAVEHTAAYHRLKLEYRTRKVLWLLDFDGYDHVAMGMTYRDVLNCQRLKMGHAFVLAMMLEDQRVWED